MWVEMLQRMGIAVRFLPNTSSKPSCIRPVVSPEPLLFQVFLKFGLFRYQLFVYCLCPRERRHHLHLDQFIRLARTFRAFNNLIHLLNGFKPLFPCHRFLPIKLSKVVRSAGIFYSGSSRDGSLTTIPSLSPEASGS
jgi:hypothetical protein